MKKVKDHYFHKAKRNGYVARSVYKLEEIDKKNTGLSVKVILCWTWGAVQVHGFSTRAEK